MEKIETLPKLLRRNYQKYGDKGVAMRRKEFGLWTEYSWKDYYEQVKYFGLGLLSLGFKKDDKLAIIGDNDPEWYWAEIGALAVGGIAFGIYVDCMPPEIKYYLEHSDAEFVVAHDQEQVDKVLLLKEQIPSIKKIIYWEPQGLWNYQDQLLISFSEIIQLGKEYEAKNPNLFEETVELGSSEDIAVFCYTSGTSGLPKGAILTHKCLMKTVELWAAADKVKERENYFSYIPPAWATEQFLGISMGIGKAWIVNFPEEPETAQKDLREIGPTRLFYGARLWESVASLVQAKIAETTALKRISYNFALKNAGYPMVKCQREKKNPGLFLRALHAVMWLLVLRPLQNKLGLSNLKVGYTAGAMYFLKKWKEAGFKDKPKAAFIGWDAPYPRGPIELATPYLTEQGFEMLSPQIYPVTAMDLTSQAMALKRAGANLIMSNVTEKFFAMLLKDARRAGIEIGLGPGKAILMSGSEGINLDVLKMAGNAAEGS